MKKKPEHPYFDAWLNRLRKQLAASGSLSQLAHVLAVEDGTTTQEWSTQLRNLLDRRIPPTFEILSRIEARMSQPGDTTEPKSSQIPLF